MRIAFAFACALVAGCSGGSDGGTTTSGSSSGGSSSGSSPGPSGVTANCGDATSSLIEGTLDGQPVNVTGATKNWSWINIGNPSKFDGTFEGGAVHLEWQGTVANESVTTATAATLTLTASAAPRKFQSASFVYDSPDPEKILKATITFDTGTVTVCMRKTD
jgi:hypothetical protein